MADHRAPPRVLLAVEPITAPRGPAWARIPLEALGGWCLLRSSKPLSGAGCGVGGGFDSHALPPFGSRVYDSFSTPVSFSFRLPSSSESAPPVTQGRPQKARASERFRGRCSAFLVFRHSNPS